MDHIARQMHHKTLRSRGHLRAYARLTRLAVIPFQLVSLCMKNELVYFKIIKNPFIYQFTLQGLCYWLYL